MADYNCKLSSSIGSIMNNSNDTISDCESNVSIETITSTTLFCATVTKSKEQIALAKKKEVKTNSFFQKLDDVSTGYVLGYN